MTRIRVLIFAMMLCALLGVPSISLSQAAGLQLDKTYFTPGEEIRVHFTAPEGLPDNAWVGIIPSNIPHGNEAVNDQHDITYQYLKGRTSGALIFQAPNQPGNWDLRMHDTDNNGQEIASVSFVVGGSAPISGPASLELDKTNFAPGEEIRVRFVAPPGLPDNAWVGIIPSNIPHGSEATNDQYDITYQYLKQRTSGELVFTAPNQPGAWDLRMHDTDNDGREIASVSFFVGGAPHTVGPIWIRLDKFSFEPGEKIAVHFSAPDSLPQNAWIGIIPSNVPHGDEATNDQYDIAYQYLEGRTSGTLIFKAPSNSGNWDFRMHDTDNNGREIASVSFVVE